MNSWRTSRFHAYCLLKQFNDYSIGSIDKEPTKSTVYLNRLAVGGAPPGSGVNGELIPIFEEMQSATEVLEHIKALLNEMTTSKNANGNQSLITTNSVLLNSAEGQSGNNMKIDEEFLASPEWLKIYGLASKKLQLFDVLSHVAFKHCDGVVDIKHAPKSGIGEAVG
jgi:hypothetical protein